MLYYQVRGELGRWGVMGLDMWNIGWRIERGMSTCGVLRMWV